jgi:hypothetical protein
VLGGRLQETEWVVLSTSWFHQQNFARTWLIQLFWSKQLVRTFFCTNCNRMVCKSLEPFLVGHFTLWLFLLFSFLSKTLYFLSNARVLFIYFYFFWKLLECACHLHRYELPDCELDKWGSGSRSSVADWEGRQKQTTESMDKLFYDGKN